MDDLEATPIYGSAHMFVAPKTGMDQGLDSLYVRGMDWNLTFQATTI